MSAKRRLRRFFLDTPLTTNTSRVQLSASESRHMVQSLRFETGDACLLVDGTGKEARARFCGLSPLGYAELEIEHNPAALGSLPEGGIRICVMQALLQKGKMDFLIEKAQELGIESFIPVKTERSVWRIDEKVFSKVLTRWNKKIQGAAKQSGQSRLVRIQSVQSLKNALSSLPPDEEAVIFHPDPKGMPFKDWIAGGQNSKKGSPMKLNLCFGPEGGFSARELTEISESKALKGRIRFVRLGASILKAETAFLGITASVKLLLP